MGVIVVVQEKKASFTPSEAPFFIDPARVCSSLRDAGHDVFLTCPEETGSTNTDLLVRARRGEASDKTEIRVAHHQTGGRGTHGRSWENARESLLFSIGLPLPAVTPAPIPLLVGFSSAEALRREGVPVFIKWPNDIVLNKKKICGILTEMSTEIDYINYVVIGVGINVNQETFPDEIKETATSLKVETGKPVKRAGVIATVMERFEQYYEQFVQQEDLSGIREAYEACLVNRDRDVRVLDPAGAYEAHAKGINDTGELIVVLPDGTEREIYAGEVSVRGIYGYV